MADIKQTILLKLQKLEDLINKNHEDEKDLFPKHWLVLLQVKNDVNTNGTVERETLEKMNKIWRINKNIEKAGSIANFKKEVWQKIEESSDNATSIRFFQASFVKDDGSEYSLGETNEIINKKAKEAKDGSSDKGNNS